MYVRSTCPTCQGTGKEYLDDGWGGTFPVTCSQCEGLGVVLETVAWSEGEQAEAEPARLPNGHEGAS